MLAERGAGRIRPAHKNLSAHYMEQNLTILPDLWGTVNDWKNWFDPLQFVYPVLLKRTVAWYAASCPADGQQYRTTYLSRSHALHCRNARIERSIAETEIQTLELPSQQEFPGGFSRRAGPTH